MEKDMLLIFDNNRVTHPPYRLSDTCFLTFLKMSFAVWLVSDFVSTPFALKPRGTIWISTSSPTCDLCEAERLTMMSRMESMFCFTARTLRWLLSTGSTLSYFHRQDRTCLLFYTWKKKKQTPFFIHKLILLYAQASSHTS